MKMKKIVAVASALSLTAAIAVGGTLAYLTKEKSITNTFTYTAGTTNINLELKEKKYNPNAKSDQNGFVGNVEGDYMTQEEFTAAGGNNGYNVIPGAKAAKNPTLFFTSSNNCYLFVELDTSDVSTVINTDELDANLAEHSWKPLDGHDGVYYLDVDGDGNATSADVKNAASETQIPVFDHVEFTENAGKFSTGDLLVKGYAVTAVDFDSPAAAWTGAGFNA